MTVRVGMVGCGGIANWHAGHLEQFDDVKVVAACDIIVERAEAMAERFGGANVYDNHTEMYEKEDLDAVFICIPPGAHTDSETAAAEKGINIFVEKPMTVCLDQAREVRDAIEKAGIVSAVGFQDRYLDIIDNLHSFIKDRKVGLFTGAWIGGMPPVHWWRVKAESGGQIVEQNIHNFDLARMLFGEVETVYAQAGTGIMVGIENYDVEDYSSVMLTFENGVIGNIITGDYLKGAVPRNGLEIYCEDARVEYQLRRAVIYHSRYNVKEERRAIDQGVRSDRTFINAVKANDPTMVRSPYRDAFRSLAVTLAANKSFETGKPIKMTY
ncbi:MAG: Gfo/Idh/MocA family oxidoreductase [Firmicutes bacterium]|nr:Gfo/Idh/MocA family oxidoreductase [Bacillota bacterium]